MQVIVARNTNAMSESEESIRISASGNADVQSDVQENIVERGSGSVL